jgi:hypothetical protein
MKRREFKWSKPLFALKHTVDQKLVCSKESVALEDSRVTGRLKYNNFTGERP